MGNNLNKQGKGTKNNSLQNPQDEVVLDKSKSGSRKQIQIGLYSTRYTAVQLQEEDNNYDKSTFIEEKSVNGEPLYKVNPEELKSIYHRSIGAFTFFNKHHEFCVGTGVLISKNLVLTAAHNIYDKDKSLNAKDKSETTLIRYQSDKSVYKFYIGGILGEKYYEVENWRFSPEYMCCSAEQKLKTDYALIKLKENVQYEQFMELSFPCITCLNEKNQYLQIFGFPRYKDNYDWLDKLGKKITLFQYGLSRQKRICYFSPQQYKIGYEINTQGGHSGSPIASEDNIIAIHNGGGKQNQKFNVGRIITADMLKNLLQWADELKGDPFKINKKLCPQLMHLFKQHKDIFGIIPYQILQILEKTKLQEELILKQKRLEAIDITKHIVLKKLNLNGNKLVAINVCSNINLMELYLECNHIQSIDLSKNINLTRLYLYRNQLAQISLRNNTNLTYLHISNNRLKAIDLSRNTNLTYINISSNQLSTIDLINSPNLGWLLLTENKLSTATFWYSSGVQSYLANQRSACCFVTLFHHKEDIEKCRQFGKEQIQFYNRDEDSNNHNSVYSFKIMEFD